MKQLFAIAVIGVAAIGLSGEAGATTFVFEGNGGYDSPTGNVAMNCGTVGVDFCTIDHAAGFTYSKDGITVTATAHTGAGPTLLIQDIEPGESGLGAFSENDIDNDQTQADSGEWIEFMFNGPVILSNIEFNAGNDVDCSTPGPEGPCGFFNLFIDGNPFGSHEATDLLTDAFIGTIFRLVPTTPNAGFAVARFDVQQVPIPAALPLLLTGLAGLRFASRKRKKA